MKYAFKKSYAAIAALCCLVALGGAAAELKKRNSQDRDAEGDYSNWRNRPHESFKNGAEVFDQVKKELLKNYIDQGLTEEDLYRAAVQGMLSNIDPSMSEWNHLLTPTEHAELVSDIKGNIVGLGIAIDFNETNGYGNVLDTSPGTPSAKSGIVRGDQILKIDGKSFKGKQLRDMVYAIRGAEGTEVTLTVLHDDKIREFKLKRQLIAFEPVDSKVIEGNIALLTIHYFSDATPKSLTKHLNELKSKQISGLIVDLRGNQGGVFDRAIESIRQFVPTGKPIVKVSKRGGQVETIAGTSAPFLPNTPMAVLINGSTKSGAEVMAAALKLSAGATAVGTNTFGKWSAQKVIELPNKFAIRYTISTFVPPNGTDLSGKGLSPDIMVNLDEDIANKLQMHPDMKIRLREDVQLQAALNILKLKQG